MSSVTSVITNETIPKLVLDDLVFTDITKILLPLIILLN